MFHINFNNPLRIHFIGIGGISMSGLAEILLKENFTVSGSDVKASELTEHLEKKGARIYIGQKASNITDDIELVVYTAAIKQDNPEYQEVIARKIPMISRAVLLGQLMTNYQNAIAVAGTHGKTTTTSMLSQILLEARRDPTISVGGILQSINGNIRVGDSETFLTEACEYTDSFLEFFPTVSIILNIEEDHLDYFKDIHHIRRSFRKFAEKLPKNGLLVINTDIPDYEEIINGLQCRIVTYGIHSGNYTAANISFDDNARGAYTLVENGTETLSLHLGTTGIHNIGNSLAAIAVAREFDIPDECIQTALEHFAGTDRRFQFKGKLDSITIMDDYAHHPTEIEATLRTAGTCKHNTLWCVFQPHTYSRTKSLLPDFAKALSLADKVILADIYAARETDTLGISSKTLLDELKKTRTECYYFPSFDEIETFLLEHCQKDDLVFTMGAGDVYLIGDHLLGK